MPSESGDGFLFEFLQSAVKEGFLSLDILIVPAGCRVESVEDLALTGDDGFFLYTLVMNGLNLSSKEDVPKSYPIPTREYNLIWKNSLQVS